MKMMKRFEERFDAKDNHFEETKTEMKDHYHRVDVLRHQVQQPRIAAEVDVKQDKRLPSVTVDTAVDGGRQTKHGGLTGVWLTTSYASILGSRVSLSCLTYAIYGGIHPYARESPCVDIFNGRRRGDTWLLNPMQQSIRTLIVVPHLFFRFSEVAYHCIEARLFVPHRNMLVMTSLSGATFVFVLPRFRLYVFVEAAALRSIVLRYAGAPIATHTYFFRFFSFCLFGDKCRFFRVFFVPLPLSL